MKSIISFPIIILALFGTTCSGFAPPPNTNRHKTHIPIQSSPDPNNPTPPNLVDKDAFVNAIDVLKRDMGIEPIPENERPPMYAIGKLVAKLPIQLVSGIRLADCDSLTLISQVRKDVADLTGIQSLDTIVAIRAGTEEGYEGDTSGKVIGDTAAVYTAAVNYAMENSLGEIELEVNRLVPMMASEE